MKSLTVQQQQKSWHKSLFITQARLFQRWASQLWGLGGWVGVGASQGFRKIIFVKRVVRVYAVEGVNGQRHAPADLT